MSRFRILIVDDQVDDGWGRILGWLKASNYLDEATELLFDCPEGSRLAWEIVDPLCGREGLSPFDVAREVVQERSSEFDFFFIDIDLSKNDFLPRTLTGVEPQYAGMDLLKVLPRDGRRAKVAFTGKEDVGVAAEAFGRFARDDLMVTDISRPTFSEDLAGLLDATMRSRQRAVVARIPPSIRRELLGSLQNGRVNWPDLSSRRLEVDDWTVGSLFPKQVVEENGRAMRSLLAFDTRQLISFLLKHPGSTEERRAFEEQHGAIGDAVEHGREGDFQLGDSVRVYKRISDFAGFSADGNIAYGLRQQLLEYCAVWEGCEAETSVADYLFAELGGSADSTEVTRWARELAISPVDLAYLCHIARLNAGKYFDGRLEGACAPTRDRLELTWSHVRVGANWSAHMNRARAAMDDQKAQPWFLSHDGLASVCKIVCVRYEGTFELRTPEGTVQVKPSVADGTYSVARGEEREKDNTSVCCVRLGAPEGRGGQKCRRL